MGSLEDLLTRQPSFRTLCENYAVSQPVAPAESGDLILAA
jgi:hypothetical protein